MPIPTQPLPKNPRTSFVLAAAAEPTRHVHPLHTSFSGNAPVTGTSPMHSSAAAAAAAAAATDEDEESSSGYNNASNGQHTPVQPLLSSASRGGGGGEGGAVVTDAALASSSTAGVVVGGIVMARAVGYTGGIDAGTGAGQGAVGGEQQRQQQQQPAVLEWKDLCYSVRLRGNYVTLPGACCRKPEMSVLTGVSGYAGPRDRAAVSGGGSTMTGILGPSGAGKSSLLDILAGRKRSGEGRATGQLSLAAGGGREDSRYGADAGFTKTAVTDAKQIRRVAGYVPQEDVLPGTLSCYEHLMFHARLRMPRGATHSQRRARALRVLEELGLSRVADSRIGDELARGLSGGERRRLSIAAELMASPALLFLDEPTTGLGTFTP